MPPDESPYETLGVPRDVSAAALKKAYRRLVMRLHPDIATEEGAAARFRAVHEAYETLRDPRRRAALDARLRSTEGPRSHAHGRSTQAPGTSSAERGDFGSDAAEVGADLEEALAEALAAFGVDPSALLDQLASGAARGFSAVFGRGRLRAGQQTLRVLGDGEVEVVVAVTPSQALLGTSVPFRYPLGPRTVEESLAIPAGTVDGARLRYRVAVDESFTLTVRLIVHHAPTDGSRRRT